MVYVRLWNGSELMGEMLLSRPLTIFEETQGCFKQNDIPLDDIIVCASDGTVLMLAPHRECIAHLLKFAGAAADDRIVEFMWIIPNLYARKRKKHFMTS
ncbi:hypothetical protein M514_27422 [Trichuris suis]|uniref:Uncharacterized protein n=1 Tax=Trichuris suis TaxID=68888 RepID=A0A085MT30_9BILA|nr:hypothetical protein M514_27422 [Trichuris suis]